MHHSRPDRFSRRAAHPPNPAPACACRNRACACAAAKSGERARAVSIRPSSLASLSARHHCGKIGGCGWAGRPRVAAVSTVASGLPSGGAHPARHKAQHTLQKKRKRIIIPNAEKEGRIIDSPVAAMCAKVSTCLYIAILTKFCTRRAAEDSIWNTARRRNAVQGFVGIAIIAPE